MNDTAGTLGEDAIIELFAHLGAAPGPEVVIPNGDDAAAWSVSEGQALVATTDTLVEGVHFDLKFGSARSVGKKLLAVNLSDLAAMGAEPRYALLSLCLRDSTPTAVLRDLAAGIDALAVAHRVAILGGNTTSIAGPLVLTATVFGVAPPAELLSRSGSKPGDAILVTGTLGDARAGLSALKLEATDDDLAAIKLLITAQLEPLPPLAAGLILRQSGRVHAACDVSDGLGRDLRRLLKSGDLGALVEAERLPISPALRALAPALSLDPIDTAVAGGEDYQLLFTADPNDQGELEALLGAAGIALSRIGTVLDQPRFELNRDGRTDALGPGFVHFQKHRIAQPTDTEEVEQESQARAGGK